MGLREGEPSAMRVNTNEVKTKLAAKAYNAKRAFTSWRGFKDWIQVADTALDQVQRVLP